MQTSGNQVQFIDTIKYYQQSLSSLVKKTSEIKKKNIRTSRLKFIERNEIYSTIFNSLPKNDKNWILDYLYGGKRVNSYGKLKTHQDRESVPENDFFSKTEFYSSLKNKIIDDESYKNVKKFGNCYILKNFLN